MKALLLLFVLAVASKPAPVVTDPARIAGSWSYTTESNCGSAGVGSVRFRWDPERLVYRVDGAVRWPATDLTIKWWGDAKYDATRRKLTATIDNSLGDKVTGEWRLEGNGPDRLVIEWQQTNGCHGLGTATRRPSCASCLWEYVHRAVVTERDRPRGRDQRARYTRRSRDALCDGPSDLPRRLRRARR